MTPPGAELAAGTASVTGELDLESAGELEPVARHEAIATFECFGGHCTVIVADRVPAADAARSAVEDAKRRLLEWHEQFSRFRPDSELSRLNSDPAELVAVSPMMRRIIEAGVRAASATGGLVDPTLGTEIERAGYASHLAETGVALTAALRAAPPRTVAGPSRTPRWAAIEVDRRAGSVRRPPGIKLDPGGIAKGVFADELAGLLSSHEAFAVDCAGDIRLGGAAEISREVDVASPFDDSVLHTFQIARGAVATSGIGKRSWVRDDGRPAHHLLDPRTGEPAYTGVVQVTALAPTASEAETLTKAAILSGPERAARWLTHGGVVVADDGSVSLIEP